jgi:uncharacterized protein
MQLREVDFAEATPIEGYGPGFFRIGGQVVTAPLCVTAKGARAWGGYKDAQVLLDLVGEIDVIFIGTGPETTHMPAELRDQLDEAGIGVEVMNSPAACRTYNVLLSEGRRVAAALLPV